MVMKSTKDRVRFNASGRLNRTGGRRIFIQCPVRPDLVVIAGVSLQDPAQMRLAQDDDMVDALAPDRSDQSFGKTVLPRRRWCDGFVPYAHGVQSACDDGAIDAIPIAD